MSDVRDRPDAYWLLLFPGLFLVISLVASNLVGEALRDALGTPPGPPECAAILVLQKLTLRGRGFILLLRTAPLA
jgi:hypothetical protein